MLRFLRFIRAARFYSRAFPYNAELDWTAGDQENTARFFNTPTGDKLMKRLEMGVVNMALSAAQTGNLHESGQASGASLQLAAIQSHFPPSQSESDYSEESDAEAALDNLESVTA